MMYAILGIICIIAGIVLTVKSTLARTKGIKLDAKLSGFAQENGAIYPEFTFTYNDEEKVLTGPNPVRNTEKYAQKYSNGATIFFEPKNDKYVTVAGDNADMVYAIGAIILGVILVIGFFA